MGNFFTNLWDDLTGKSAGKQLAEAQDTASARSTAAAEKADALNREAIDRQFQWEKEKQAKIDEEKNTIKGIGMGGLYNTKDGVPGAMDQSQNWLQDYLKYLTTGADTTYNAEKGAIARQGADAYNQADRAMRARGLNMSGLGALPFGNIATQMGGMLGNAEAGREQRKGQNLATGTQLTQDALKQWLNMLMQGSNIQGLQSTQVPGMMQSNANQGLNLALNQSNQGLNTALAQSQMGNPLGQAARNAAGNWLTSYLTKNKTPSFQNSPAVEQQPSTLQKGLQALMMSFGM